LGTNRVTGMKNDLRDLVLDQGNNPDQCWVCGQANKDGLRIPFHRDGEHGAKADYTSRVEHDGWPGVLHGGITFALMDEALAWALFFQGIRGVTARAETSFKRPIRTGTPLAIRGWTTTRRRRLITAQAEIRSGAPGLELMAEMEATMFVLAENAPPAEPQAGVTAS
jgi:acyl-coenzyme A thioesterase PaaI-like protein